MRFTTCPPEQRQALRPRAKCPWPGPPPSLLSDIPWYVDSSPELGRTTAHASLFKRPIPAARDQSIATAETKCCATFPLALNMNKCSPEPQDVRQTAEDNQPAEPARLGSVQTFGRSLPRPRPILLICSSFVQGEMVQMLCAGYAQHASDLLFLSPSSISKQPLQPFLAK